MTAFQADGAAFCLGLIKKCQRVDTFTKGVGLMNEQEEKPLRTPSHYTVPFRHFTVTDDTDADRKEVITKVVYAAILISLGFWMGVSVTLWITLVVLGVH